MDGSAERRIELTIGKIIDKVSMPALYAMLAEEAAELAHAACKAFRYTEGSNPTPLTSDAIYDNLIEELSDVALVASVLGIYPEYDIMHEKQQRWEERLSD